MSIIRNKSKSFLFKLFKRLAIKKSKNKAIILNFHRVTNEPGNMFDNNLGAKEFKSKMLFLRDNFNVVSFPELVTQAKKKTIKPLTIAISIDDGYEDGYSVILPILQELGLTAAFFIATEGIEKGGLWNDYISTAFNKTTKQQLENYLDFPTFDLSTIELRKKAHDIIHDKCKFLPLNERGEAVEQLLVALSVDVKLDVFMSKKQIKSLKVAGMAIGAHTHKHPILALESEKNSYQEIKKSKEVLEGILGEDIKYFAYPNGKKNRDFNDAHVQVLEKLNFEAALMTEWGHFTPETNMLTIPRFTPWDKDVLSFGIRLCHYFRK